MARYWLFMAIMAIKKRENVFQSYGPRGVTPPPLFFSEISIGLKQKKSKDAKQPCSCDLDRIQTCNRLSRNQVFYSVELRGQSYTNVELFNQEFKFNFHLITDQN